MVSKAKTASITRAVKTWVDGYEPSRKTAKMASDQLLVAIAEYRGSVRFLIEQDLKKLDTLKAQVIERNTSIPFMDVPTLQLRFGSLRNDQLAKIVPKNYGECLALQQELRRRGDQTLTDRANGLDNERYGFENSHLTDPEYTGARKDLLTRQAYYSNAEAFVETPQNISSTSGPVPIRFLPDIVSEVAGGDRELAAQIRGMIAPALGSGDGLPGDILKKCSELASEGS